MSALFTIVLPVFLVIAYWVIGCSIVLGLTFDNIGAALTVSLQIRATIFGAMNRRTP